MKDYDELWNQYAIKFNDKLENTNNGDWNKLDEIEQEIAALWKLAADMYSAGEEDGKILEYTFEAFDEKLGPLLCTRAYEFYGEKLKKTV